MNKKRIRRLLGFTVVELLIVIVVIAILAAITVIAYGGIQRQAVSSSMQHTVRQVAKKMDEIRAESDTYPSLIPGMVKIPSGIGVALTVVDTPVSQFCINVTTPRYSGMSWHIAQDQVLSEGLCAGDVIEASIVGDYDTGSTPPLPATPVVSLASADGKFRLVTNENWLTFTLSWDPIPDTTRYEIQTQYDNGDWFWRRTSGGSGSVAPVGTPSTSYVISPSTTQVVWTAAEARVPEVDKGHKYRLRAHTSSGVTDWQTIDFPPMRNNKITQIANFAVKAESQWDSITLAWDDVSQNNVPGAKIEVQSRIAGGDWFWRRMSGGSGAVAPVGAPSVSFWANPTVRSLSWSANESRPTSGVPHEYRVRLRSETIAGVYSEWRSGSLTLPTMPKVSGFTVTPNAQWSAVELKWSAVGASVNLPRPGIEVQHRVAGGDWHWRRTSGGADPVLAVEGGSSSVSFTGQLAMTTTTVNWNNAGSIPSPGGVHEYRVRVRSTNIAGGHPGEWSTVVLSRP